jgi:hypothetical protein
MDRDELLKILNEAKKKIEEAADLIVQVDIEAMNRGESWYSGVCEQIEWHLYKAKRELRELFDLVHLEEE